jgi:hypothetical protein
VDGGVGVAGNLVYTFNNTRVVSLGTGFFPIENKAPEGLLGWLEWTVQVMLDAPWKLPHAIDMADTESIPELVALGQQAAQTMDWQSILN